VRTSVCPMGSSEVDVIGGFAALKRKFYAAALQKKRRKIAQLRVISCDSEHFPRTWATPASSRQRAAWLGAAHTKMPAGGRAFWPDRHASLHASASGFGSPGWIRTTECLSQSQVPYRLATGLGCLV
jgi:hypothetical protein